jgi:integrase
MVYFGPWDDPDGALTKYLDQKDALHAGRTPRSDAGELTIKDLANAFLNQKTAAMETGELSIHTFNDYKRTCDLLVSTFGKQRLIADLRPEDFAAMRKQMAKKWGLQRIAKSIQFVRCVFKYGYDAELIAAPVRFGPGFKRPTKKSFRLAKAKAGAKLFTCEEILAMIDAAGVPLKAMILLGINAGMGNSDCGTLPTSALDLDAGFLDHPRPKTGIPRRAVLWPETVEAIREAIAARPKPKKAEHADLVFITKYGGTWGKDTSDNPVSKEMRKLLDQLEINGHRNFYVLRHVFRTVADDNQDQPAADFIMGHSRDDMASVYRERISDERLRAVADHVHAWLFSRDDITS